MKAVFAIADTNRSVVATELSKILADEYVLYTKTKNAHWNVANADRFDKHKFFECQFRRVEQFIEMIATQIRSIGCYPPATLNSFLLLTRLSEIDTENNSSQGFIKELLSDHECIIIQLRKTNDYIDNDFHHPGTSIFITRLLENHLRMSCTLRAHL